MIDTAEDKARLSKAMTGAGNIQRVLDAPATVVFLADNGAAALGFKASDRSHTLSCLPLPTPPAPSSMRWACRAHLPATQGSSSGRREADGRSNVPPPNRLPCLLRASKLA